MPTGASGAPQAIPNDFFVVAQLRGSSIERALTFAVAERGFAIYIFALSFLWNLRGSHLT